MPVSRLQASTEANTHLHLLSIALDKFTPTFDISLEISFSTGEATILF